MALSTSLMFNEAARHLRRLCLGLAIVAVYLMALGAPALDPLLAQLVEPFLPLATAFALFGALSILAAGLASAALTAAARLSVLRALRRRQDLGLPQEAEADERRSPELRRAAWPAGWPEILVSLAFGSAAVLAAVAAWRTSQPVAPQNEGAIPFTILAFMLSFAPIVVERHLSAMAPSAWPEAGGLARLLRVVIASLLVLGLGRLAVHAGFGWGVFASRAVAAAALLVGLELGLRALARAFLPFGFPDAAIARPSSVAGLLRGTIPSPAGMGAAIRETFGIDVSQSWALGFLRRAALPSLACFALAAWLVSGLVTLPTGERGVYERFGLPVGVLDPGLHVILPWPAGRLRRVDFGVMHSLSLGLPADMPAAELAMIAQRDGDDRLWDRPHPGEAVYLIASESGGTQSFQAVAIDMRLIWHVGDTARDALAFIYDADDPAAIIRGLAGRLLAQRFAGSTLPAVLVADRAAFIEAFRRDLQTECDNLQLGVAVAAVIIEAIHPPAGAAAAYHAVEAAELQARVAVAKARGSAIEAKAVARQDANAAKDAALVSSAEILAAAQTESRFFDADRAAAAQNGPAFLLERRLDAVSRALQNRALIILDHRIDPQALPLLDLRGSTALP